MFTALHGIEVDEVVEDLDTNPGRYVEKARLDIEQNRSEELRRLREVADRAPFD